MPLAAREAIHRRLVTFDGKSVEPFRQVAAELPPSAESIRLMLSLCEDSVEPAVHIGATWVVKDLLESHSQAPQDLANRVFSLLERVEAPDATLHLLQILPYAEVPGDLAGRLFELGEKFAAAERTFVRAWALNALAIAALADPDLRPRVLERFDAALRSEKASVKARVRKARERLLEAAQ